MMGNGGVGDGDGDVVGNDDGDGDGGDIVQDCVRALTMAIREATRHIESQGIAIETGEVARDEMVTRLSFSLSRSSSGTLTKAVADAFLYASSPDCISFVEIRSCSPFAQARRGIFVPNLSLRDSGQDTSMMGMGMVEAVPLQLALFEGNVHHSMKIGTDVVVLSTGSVPATLGKSRVSHVSRSIIDTLSKSSLSRYSTLPNPLGTVCPPALLLSAMAIPCGDGCIITVKDVSSATIILGSVQGTSQEDSAVKFQAKRLLKRLHCALKDGVIVPGAGQSELQCR